MKIEYQAASILLVEDDDIDARGVERSFRKLRIGNPIIRAKDGLEALEILQSGEISKPYLILLDLNLPRMGGLELLECLRQDPELKSSVVFILTTSKAEEDKFAAYSKHVAGYIVKENLESSFDELTKLLDHYWRIVDLPTH